MENPAAPRKRGRPPKVKENPLDALKPQPGEFQKISPTEYPPHLASAPTRVEEVSFGDATPAPKREPKGARVAEDPSDVTVPIIGEAEAAAIWADVEAKERAADDGALAARTDDPGVAAAAWVDGDDAPKPKRGRPKGSKTRPKADPVLEETIPTAEPFDPARVRAELRGEVIVAGPEHVGEPFQAGMELSVTPLPLPKDAPMFTDAGDAGPAIDDELREADALLERVRADGPGFFTIPEGVYWKLNAIHSSDLKVAFERSALHLAARVDEDTAALRFGRAFHARMEGRPLPPGTSKGDAARVESMVTRALAHPAVARTVRETLDRPELVETTGVVWDEEFGVFRCIRVDALLPHLGILVDWKTTSDASEASFTQAAGRYGYFLQAAYYLDTANLIRRARPRCAALPVELDSFILVAVESKPPHDVQVFEIPHVGIELGREQYRKALAKIRDAAAGLHMGYSQDIKSLVPPAWLFYK